MNMNNRTGKSKEINRLLYVWSFIFNKRPALYGSLNNLCFFHFSRDNNEAKGTTDARDHHHQDNNGKGKKNKTLKK